MHKNRKLICKKNNVIFLRKCKYQDDNKCILFKIEIFFIRYS